MFNEIWPLISVVLGIVILLVWQCKMVITNNS